MPKKVEPVEQYDIFGVSFEVGDKVCWTNYATSLVLPATVVGFTPKRVTIEYEYEGVVDRVNTKGERLCVSIINKLEGNEE